MERLNDLFFSSKASDGLTYEQILTDVQRFVTQNHADTLSNEGNPEEARALDSLPMDLQDKRSCQG